MFEYKRILVPKEIKICLDIIDGHLCIRDAFLESIIKAHKIEGWELYQIYTTSIKPYKRLIDSLLRRKLQKIDQLVIELRRKLSEPRSSY